MPPYDDDRLLYLLATAIQRTWNEPGHLIARHTHERSVTHRIGHHLQELIENPYIVDCEYNRNIDFSKIIHVDLNDGLGIRAINSVPDIIVHQRLSNNANLLVVECKLGLENEGGRDYDVAKLKAFTDPNQYGYQLGVFVGLDTEQLGATIVKVKNGEVDGQDNLDGILSRPVAQ